MSRATSIKEACANWEKKYEKKVEEAEHVSLICQIPSIDKMDALLSTLKNCTQLSLSTNQIEKIANLNALRNLRILSLGRNNIKSLTGLDAVGDTLCELWISYNLIEKLKGIWVLKKLTTLYMVHNKVFDVKELEKLDELPCLEKLTFNGNPLAIELESAGRYRSTVKTMVKKLKHLDGLPIIRDEGEDDDLQVEQKG